MPVTRLQHTSVPMPAGEQAAARHFYGTVMEMVEKIPPISIIEQGLIWFHAGEDEIHLFRDDEGPGNDRQHFCLQVDDIEHYRQQFRSHGIEIEETTAVANRPRFFVSDPFGNRIEITEVQGEYIPAAETI